MNWIDLLVSLSLANLCFARVWRTQFFAESCELYIRSEPPTRKRSLQTILTVILLATLFWLCLTAIRFLPSTLSVVTRYLFLTTGSAVAAVQLLAIFPRKVKHFWQDYRGRIARTPSPIRRRLILSGIAVTAGSLVVIFVILVVPLLAVLSPLTVITFGFAAISVARPRTPFTSMSPADVRPHPPRRKVIWLLLDEFDQRLGFESRPAGLQLPNLDRFLESSLIATHAIPPCRCTEISIPALLTGQMVKETIVSANECVLCLDPPQINVPLTSCTTVFKRAREKGFNCALSGWYHPYDRLIGQHLVACRWYEAPDQENSLPKHGVAYIYGLLRSLIETSSYSPFGQSLTVQKWVRTWHSVLHDAIEFSTRPDLDLIVLHWTIPHAPYVFDPATGTTSLTNSPLLGYFGNLELADSGFGMLQSALANVDALKNVSFVISSDHWWRGAGLYDGYIDYRVPFIVKLWNSETRYYYDRPFNTVLSADLALGLLDGTIPDLATLVTWLDTHGKDLPPTKT